MAGAGRSHGNVRARRSSTNDRLLLVPRHCLLVVSQLLAPKKQRSELEIGADDAAPQSRHQSSSEPSWSCSASRPCRCCPGLENWSHTYRPGQSFIEIADTSLPYRALTRLFVPNFFGSLGTQSGGYSFWGADPQSPSVLQTISVAGATAESRHTTPGFWQYWEFSAYSGQIFWVAVVLILSNWRRAPNKRTVGLFLIVWLMALWFMLGRYGGLFNILYRILPGASLFRGRKMSCVATFAAAVIVAYLVELVCREGTKLRLWPALLLLAGYTGFLAVLDFGGEHLLAELGDWERLSLARHETWYALMIMTCVLAGVWAACRPKHSTHAVGLLVLTALLIADANHSYGGFTYRFDDPDVYYSLETVPSSQLEAWRAQRGPFRCGQFSEGRPTEEKAWHRNLPYFCDSLEVPEGYASYALYSILQFSHVTNERAKTDIQNIGLAIK